MRSKKYIISLLIISIIFSVLFLNSALAEEDTSHIKDIAEKSLKFRETAGYGVPEHPQAVVISIIDIVLGLLGLGFLVLIIISGIQWMTSGGNEEKIDKARKNIINATIGLGIILAAWVISNFIFENIQKAAEDPYFWL